MNLNEDVHSGITKQPVVLPSFVEFLQSIVAKQKIELERIQQMDIKAVANGNGSS
jgi:hypothetical protein